MITLFVTVALGARSFGCQRPWLRILARIMLLFHFLDLKWRIANGPQMIRAIYLFFLALLTKDLPEAGLKCWQLLAMPAKDFPRTG
jgi:hypothetical protein